MNRIVLFVVLILAATAANAQAPPQRPVLDGCGDQARLVEGSNDTQGVVAGHLVRTCKMLFTHAWTSKPRCFAYETMRYGDTKAWYYGDAIEWPTTHSDATVVASPLDWPSAEGGGYGYVYRCEERS